MSRISRKNRKLAVRIGAGALLSAAVLGLSPVAAQAAPHWITGKAAEGRTAEPRFADRTLEVSYDNGFRFELDFEGSRTAHWKVLAGQDPAEGTVTVDHREEAPGVYRLTWTEADGTTVEQVQNWRDRTVTAVIEFDNNGTKERLDLRGTFTTVC
ncbi:MoaF N-terminal domain-containing protein [Streptomyces sp. UNOC14_S4]|uniref:MoaF-related domain-containing protein n=1 Tax=Streptomyces sp. UNOC14_S4 TaxID=2872340 RepID=UPI001E2CCB7D|nr:MoaF N-terminal domain-containing protein [Streptomyces sp. UNOC14_S4]MCC3771513.1 MoaF N-terminal domain-containing protein [Streptomyces sp. UNOC14_S4]